MGLKQMGSNTGFNDAMKGVAWTVAAIRARGEEGDKEVAVLADVPAALLKDIEQQAAARLARVPLTVQSQVQGKRAMVLVQDTVVRVHNSLLGRYDQDRQAEGFARFFPEPLSTIANRGLTGRLDVVQAIQAQLASPKTPHDLRKEHEKPLATAYKIGAAAIAGREKVQQAESDGVEEFAHWREGANTALFGLEGRLQHIASSRGLDRSWVDDFFPEVKSVKKAAPAETPPPDTGPSTAPPPTPPNSAESGTTSLEAKKAA